MMNKAIYLTIMEARLLLYKKRVTGLVMFSELTEKIDSDFEAKKAVEQLIEDGYLKPSGDLEGFSFSEDIEEIIDILSRSFYTFRIKARQNKEPVRCMYLAEDKSVIMEMDMHAKDMIRIEAFEQDEAIDSIMDADYLATASFGPDTFSGENVDVTDFDSEFEMPEGRLLIERYERGNAEYDRRILVTEGDSNDNIYVEDITGIKKGLYTENTFKDAILEDSYDIN